MEYLNHIAVQLSCILALASVTGNNSYFSIFIATLVTLDKAIISTVFLVLMESVLARTSDLVLIVFNAKNL